MYICYHVKKKCLENAFYPFIPYQKIIFFLEMSMNSRHAGHGNLEFGQQEEFGTRMNELRGLYVHTWRYQE